MKSNNDELFELYSKDKHNIEIRNKIAINNLNLVPYTINKYHLYVDVIHDYEEMLQEGYLALIKAVETFDNSLGYQFSSYAIKCILNLTRNRLDYNKDISLNTPLNDDLESNVELIDTLKDDNINIEKDFINESFYKDIRKELSLNLNDIEDKIIKGYYGINQEIKSYNDLVLQLNLSLRDIKKIKVKAENKIRKSSYFKKLYRERNPISYYPSFNYDNTKTSPTNKINSPVENIVMKKLDQDRNLILKTLK